MSWDISLTAKRLVDVEVGDIGNYTYNVSKMYRVAMGISLSELDGQKATDVIPMIRKGVDEMLANPEKYRAMNPPNGWGSYEGALDYIQKLLHECEKNPDSIIRVS
ncbi:hypothetical protein ACIQD3_22665 [Peribacillus loiseleuriae]|uniref:hypothetical protein n=1 Tax=Peribacillus loiseleuriae TaxID=1679170 RepID=UPI00382E0448